MFVTQRTEPKLALVRVKLPSEVLSPSWDGILPPDAAMTITAPGMPTALEVPLAPASPLPRCKVGVWEWEGLAGDEGSEASEWFTRYLGKTKSVIRLVRWLGDGALPPAKGWVVYSSKVKPGQWKPALELSVRLRGLSNPHHA